jgi:hypothetical protein
MRKPVKNERAKRVTPRVPLAQVVGGADDNATTETQLFEEDSNRYRTGLR